MNEMLLSKKRGGALNGITIEGWNGTLTKTAGVTADGVGYQFANNGNVNYIRIPRVNTPSPSSENCEVEVRFNIKSANSTRLYIITRYRQGSDPPSWSISVNASKQLELVYNNLVHPTVTPILFDVVNKVVFRRLGDHYYVILNDVQVIDLNYPGIRTSAADWVFGSYLNFGDAVIVAAPVASADWKLIAANVKRI